MRSTVGLAVLGLLASLTSAGAQGVLIAPQAVIVDEAAGGVLTISNPTGERVEVALSTMYGYPVSDERGQLKLRTFDVVDDTMPSAASWITAYPRRFTLDAGQRQTVRLVVAAPNATPGREYWARLVVSSKGALPAAAVATTDSSAPVSMRLDLEVRSVLPVLYRRGAVATKVVIDSVSTDQTPDSVGVRPSLHREGSAAWVGTVSMVLRNASNAEVRKLDVPLAVYYFLSPRFALPVTGLPSGRYTLEVTAAAQRMDLPRHHVLKSPTEVHRAEFRIP